MCMFYFVFALFFLLVTITIFIIIIYNVLFKNKIKKEKKISFLK